MPVPVTPAPSPDVDIPQEWVSFSSPRYPTKLILKPVRVLAPQPSPETSDSETDYWRRPAWGRGRRPRPRRIESEDEEDSASGSLPAPVCNLQNSKAGPFVCKRALELDGTMSYAS